MENSGYVTRTAESIGMVDSLLDPLANTNNFMTAEAAMAVIKAGFLKPKESSEIRTTQRQSSRTNSIRRKEENSQLLTHLTTRNSNAELGNTIDLVKSQEIFYKGDLKFKITNKSSDELPCAKPLRASNPNYDFNAQRDNSNQHNSGQ